MKYTAMTYVTPNEAASLSAMIDCFSRAMENKLLAKLKSGRSGWDDSSWTEEDILKALKEHLEKGDMIDVANFAMFYWNREDFPHIKLHRATEKGQP